VTKKCDGEELHWHSDGFACFRYPQINICFSIPSVCVHSSLIIFHRSTKNIRILAPSIVSFNPPPQKKNFVFLKPAKRFLLLFSSLRMPLPKQNCTDSVFRKSTVCFLDVEVCMLRLRTDSFAFSLPSQLVHTNNNSIRNQGNHTLIWYWLSYCITINTYFDTRVKIYVIPLSVSLANAYISCVPVTLQIFVYT
jgi:hypothetical protein